MVRNCVARLSLYAVLLGVVVGFTGCVPAEPGPEAILEGVWLLESDDQPQEVSDFLVTFNSFGQVTRVEFMFEDSEVVIEPQNLQSSADVEGNDVTITVSWGVNNVTFEGTLNADQTVITGTSTLRITVGGITVTQPAVDAVLTKQ